MTVRKKIFIVMSISMVLIIVAALFLTQTFLEKNTDAEEKTRVHNDIQLVINTLENELSTLDRQANAYASRDDTYAFIQHPSEDYVKSNVVNATFTIHNWNLMLFLNKEGRIVLAKAFDLETDKEVPVSPSLFAHLNPESPLLKHESGSRGLSGFLVLPENVYIVASRPIVGSGNKGPIQGTLIMAKILDNRMLDRLGQMTHLPLRVSRGQGQDLASAVRKTLTSSPEKYPEAIEFLTAKTIAGYIQIKDIYGKPALVISIEGFRNLHAQFHRSLNYFLIALIVYGLFGLMLSLFFVDRLATSKLRTLADFVKTIESGDSLHKRAMIRGKDELSGLAHAINDMLESLDRSNRERQEMIQRLEKYSIMDELTGLYNRRGFLTIGSEYLNLAARNKTKMFLLYMDMDNLKEINDTYGHHIGDAALVRLAKILKHTFRQSDIKGRMGGDEFAIFPIDTSIAGVEVAIGRLNKNIETFNASGEDLFKLSLSTGVAGYDPHQPSTIEDLLIRADKSMYEQKKKNRNV
jgi:diguanylate cyclase (GGDEF)-like protein